MDDDIIRDASSALAGFVTPPDAAVNAKRASLLKIYDINAIRACFRQAGKR
jgi:hypothetical protein